MQDLIVVVITSQLTDDYAVMIELSDCVDGALPKTSVVKLSKVFTIHATIIIKRICALQPEVERSPDRSPTVPLLNCGAPRTRIISDNRLASRMSRPVVAVVLQSDVAAVFDSSAKVNAQMR
jgi:hypothetical protein